MKRVLVILSYFLITLSPTSAFAHESKEDNNTIVVLHVNPNDSPVVGQKAGITFLITGSHVSFPSSLCDCTGTVLDNSTVLTSKKLFTQGKLRDSIPYTFTHPGIYQIRVTGTPQDPTTFKPFTIIFNLRVAGNNTQQKFYSQNIEYISGGFFLLALGILVYTHKIYKKV